MANNCLVTELKGSVNNNTIPFYGGVTFKNESNQVSTLVCERATIKVLEGSAYLDAAKTQPITTETLLVGTACAYIDPNAVVVIRSKYADSFIQIGYKPDYTPQGLLTMMDISQLEYSNMVRLFGDNFIPKGVVDINKLSDITNFQIRNVQVQGVFKIANGSNLHNVQHFYVTAWGAHTDNVYCDISVFSESRDLVKLQLQDEINVTGDVNTLLDSLYNNGNGRTSGTVTICVGGTKCTYTPAGGTQKVLTHEDGVANGWNIVVTFSASGWTAVQN